MKQNSLLQVDYDVKNIQNNVLKNALYMKVPFIMLGLQIKFMFNR